MKGPESYIFTTVTRFAFFLINVFALYLLLRGHNLPGGGFIGGLATAISMILLSLAVGMREVHRVIAVDPVRIAVLGLVISAGTALAPILMGRPFLEHFNWDWQLPFAGNIQVGTPLLFDIGVYLVVVGVTSKMIFLLAKSTQGLAALVREEQARYSSPKEEPVETEAAEEAAEPVEPPSR